MIAWSVFAVEIFWFGSDNTLLTSCHYYLVTMAFIANGCLVWGIRCIGSLFECLSQGLQGYSDPGQLVQLYHQLAVTCGYLLNVYSWQLLIFLTSSFVVSTSKAYMTIFYIDKEDPYAILSLAWVVMLYVHCFRIIGTCEFSREQVSLTKLLHTFGHF